MAASGDERVRCHVSMEVWLRTGLAIWYLYAVSFSPLANKRATVASRPQLTNRLAIDPKFLAMNASSLDMVRVRSNAPLEAAPLMNWHSCAFS